MAKKKINIEEKMIELGYEGFNFSKRGKIFLTSNNISKDILITLTQDDFRNKYYDERYKGFLHDLANVLNDNGYPSLLDQLNEPSPLELEYIKLGYTQDFNWGISFNRALRKGNISLEQLCKMTYDEIIKFKGIGHEKVCLVKSELERFGYENNIVIGLSPEELKIEKEKQQKDLKEKLITLLIEKSNLDPKNNLYDKWIISEYKKSIKDLTIKSLVVRIKQLEELE